MTRVKICGITNLEDAWVAVEAGANLVGFIFYEPSPRYVSPEMVRPIVAAVKQESRKGSRESGGEDVPRSTSPIICVGVFVNETPETVRQVLDFCRLDAAQFHGEESPAEVASFAGIAYKALRPQSAAEAYALAAAYTHLTEQAAGSRQNEQLTISNEQLTNPTLQPSSLPAFQPSSLPTLQPSSLPAFQPSSLPTLLLDAYHPDLYGGTGHLVDWTTAADIARTQRLMLAGSLTPENVEAAIWAVRPWGVDVSSGVEATKGKKDHKKLRAFLEAVRNVDRGT